MFNWSKIASHKALNSLNIGSLVLKPRNYFSLNFTACSLSSAQSYAYYSNDSIYLKPDQRAIDQLSKEGLFGIENLTAPNQWVKLTEEAVQKAQFYVDEIVGKDLDLKTLFIYFDKISSLVCKMVDPAELCRNIHPDEIWRNSASDALNYGSSYFYHLNANRGLYDKLKKAVDSKEFNDLPEDFKFFANSMKSDFEEKGIHLPERERQQLIQVQQEIDYLGYQYSVNIRDPKQQEWLHTDNFNEERTRKNAVKK